MDDCRSDSFQPIPMMANSLCLDEPEKPQDASTQDEFAKDSRLAKTQSMESGADWGKHQNQVWVRLLDRITTAASELEK